MNPLDFDPDLTATPAPTKAPKAYCWICQEDHGEPDWMDITDAAGALGVSQSAIYQWVDKRRVRIGEGSNGKRLIDIGCKRSRSHQQTKQQRGKSPVQTLKIGIISKKDHAKSHAAALRRVGHKVHLLGGDTTVRIPPSLDVLVCRNASCSHGASDKALKISREGRTPVIFEDSLTKIVAAVRDLTPQKKKKGAQPNMPQQNQQNTRELLGDLLRTAGILYPSMLREKKPSQIAAFAHDQLGLPGETGRIAGLMQSLQDRNTGTIARGNSDLRGTGTFPTTVLWRVTPKNRSFVVSILTTIPLTEPLIDTLCAWGNFTREQAPGSSAITGKFGHPSPQADDAEAKIEEVTGESALTKPIYGTYYRAYCYKASGRWSVRRQKDPKGKEHFGSFDRAEVVAKIAEMDAEFSGAEFGGREASNTQYLVVRGALPTSRLDRMQMRIKEILEQDIPWSDTLTEARELSDLFYETVANAPKRRFPFRRVDGVIEVGRSFSPHRKDQRISVTPVKAEWFDWLAPENYVSTKALRSGRPDYTPGVPSVSTSPKDSLKEAPAGDPAMQNLSLPPKKGAPAPEEVKFVEKIITEHFRAYPRNSSGGEGSWRWAIHAKGKYHSKFTGTVEQMTAHLASLNDATPVAELPPEAGGVVDPVVAAPPTVATKPPKPEKPEKVTSQFSRAYAKTWKGGNTWRWDTHRRDGSYTGSFVGTPAEVVVELNARDIVIEAAKVVEATKAAQVATPAAPVEVVPVPAPAAPAAPVAAPVAQNGTPPATPAAVPSSMDTLTDLLRQLRIQMRVMNLTEISLTEDGAVNFKRKKIVTVIEDGTLSL